MDFIISPDAGFIFKAMRDNCERMSKQRETEPTHSDVITWKSSNKSELASDWRRGFVKKIIKLSDGHVGLQLQVEMLNVEYLRLIIYETGGNKKSFTHKSVKIFYCELFSSGSLAPYLPAVSWDTVSWGLEPAPGRAESARCETPGLYRPTRKWCALNTGWRAP